MKIDLTHGLTLLQISMELFRKVHDVIKESNKLNALEQLHFKSKVDNKVDFDVYDLVKNIWNLGDECQFPAHSMYRKVYII